MRNDNRRWDPLGDLSFSSPDLMIEEVSLTRQLYVSGCGVLKRFEASLISWPDIVTDLSCALVLRRDLILAVGGSELEEGFHEKEGLAVSDVSDAFTVLDLTGVAAFDCLRSGAELRLDQPSKSVVRQVFGVDVFLYRVADAASFRVHVPRSLAIGFRKALIASV